ncbi:MAG: hypothetical protein AABO58_17100 [Acidobacteriota bacterium]
MLLGRAERFENRLGCPATLYPVMHAMTAATTRSQRAFPKAKTDSSVTPARRDAAKTQLASNIDPAQQRRPSERQPARVSKPWRAWFEKFSPQWCRLMPSSSFHAWSRTSSCTSVKRHVNQKATEADGTSSYVTITLKPLNPTYQPNVLRVEDEGTVQVVAEFAEVL